MDKIYNIADKFIRITSEHDNVNDDNIGIFECNYNGKCNINYKIKRIDSLYKVNGDLIAEFIDLKIYKSEDNLIWEYICPVNEKKYCYLIEGIDNNNEILIYDKLKKVFPSIRDIFIKINFQGALLSKEVLMLHSSFIIHNNESILFTAPSGTGKSTQASLWEKYRCAEIINGDRSTIGIRDDEYFAYGLPFCGSSDICKNKCAKIKAIVYLEQSKENKVRQLSKIEAFKLLLSQVAINRWNKKDMHLAMSLVESLIYKVPVLLLSCKPDKEAVDVLYNFLYK